LGIRGLGCSGGGGRGCDVGNPTDEGKAYNGPCRAEECGSACRQGIDGPRKDTGFPTLRGWGPDRIAGFSPIPAMSPVSYASGARFLELIGAPMLSFYDWYADLPNASPQMFGDQTDVPESGDWSDAGYLVMWGSNVPVTRTPDAHWMAEARYRGQKVVDVAPDYADNVKFAVVEFVGFAGLVLITIPGLFTSETSSAPIS